MKIRCQLAIFAMALLISPAAHAQDPLVFGEFVAVELVLVDVLVEGKDGQPILDLEREDFKVLQDGRPVEISQFTPARGVASKASGAAKTPSSQAAPARHLIIFVDNVHLNPISRQRVFTQLSKTLDDYLEKQDEVMMVSYTGTTEVVLPMTRDRRALRSALKDQIRAEAINLMADNETTRILETIQSARDTYAQTRAGAPDAACRDVGHLAHNHALQVHNRIQGTIAELDRFVNSLAAYEGPKMLLHVSDGIPLVAGAEAYSYAAELCDGSGLMKGLQGAMDTTTSSGLRYNYWDPTQVQATLREFDTSSDWQRLAGNANTYQVSIYPFQAQQSSHRAGTVASVQTSFETERNAEHNIQDSLFIMAEETGGVAIFESNEIEPALQRMSDDARYRYQLAYEPPTRGDGKRHHIVVDVDRPNVKVRHRQSYRSKGQEERISDHVLSVLLHGRQENPLSVKLDVAEQTPESNNLTNVQIRVRVPLEQLALLPAEESRQGLFTVFVAVRSGRSRITPVGQKTLPVRVLDSETQPTEYEYLVEVPIYGNSGDVAVGVQDRVGGEVSYVRKNVRIVSTS